MSDAITRTQALEVAEIATARCAAALDALAWLVAHLTRVGGYLTPEDQYALRAARALLVESGR